MVDLYRPANGTEGADFQEAFCCHCSRDAAFRDSNYEDPSLGCKILADTFVYDVDDPNYPKQWIYDNDGSPCCTAFTTDVPPPVRCDKTIDMFE